MSDMSAMSATNAEFNVRLVAKKVLTFIERRASETGNALPADLLSFINEVKDVRWDQAYEKTMMYRVLPDYMRVSTIKDKLPFLTVDEANSVKLYLDYICDFAGKN